MSSRLKKLKRYRQQAIDLENFLKSKAITDLPAGKDISPLISQLEELKMQLKALSEAEALRLVKLEEERKAKEAEARRLAKLEEERKAKQAEARRLAKLAEERKAKEAEARRLAKLEKERRSKKS